MTALRVPGVAPLVALVSLLALPLAPVAEHAAVEHALLQAKAQARTASSLGEPRLAAALMRGLPAAVPGVTMLTYDARTGLPKDPVNVVFIGTASAWDVNYDLQNWARTPWVTARGGRQAVAENGGWSTDVYQLKPSGSGEFPAPRYHVRLFSEGGVTLADAHHDNPAHSCGGDWEAASKRLVDSFRDASGRPLWFVSRIYQVRGLGPPAGPVQCGYYDGLTTVVVLGDGTRRPLASHSTALEQAIARAAPATTSAR